MKASHYKLLAGQILAVFMVVMGAPAAPGNLDLSLAGTGLVQIGFGGAQSQGQAVALQPDGKVVVAGTAGDLVVARFGTNNVLDPTFGTGGIAAVAINGLLEVVAVALGPDGSIVVAGQVDSGPSTGYDFLIVCFNPNGSLNSSFGAGGILVADFGGRDYCYGLAVQADSKIVVGGESIHSNPSAGYAVVARYQTNGVPDATFGNNGTFLQVNQTVGALALEGDGNIVAGGVLSASNIGLFRLNTNGVLDTSFGSGGQVVFPHGAGYDIKAIAIQPAGIQISQPEMILAAGPAVGGVMLGRVTLHGILDTNFNGTGTVTQPVPGGDVHVTGLEGLFVRVGFSRVIRIVMSGTQGSLGDQFLAARFTANGPLDSTFGNGGIVTTPLNSTSGQANGLVVESGPALLLAGTSAPDSCSSDFALARYNWSDGSLDTNFNGSGILLQQVANLGAEAKAVAIQSDGKLVVAGDCGGCPQQTALCRLNPDGSLDPSFGSGGKAVAVFGSADSQANAMAIQPDGKIVTAGTVLARFLTNGTLDSSFGTAGSVTFATNIASAFAVALQPDGKIVVGASCSVNGNDLAVLRFNPDGSADPNWNGTGKVFTSVGSNGDHYNAVTLQADGKVLAAGYSVVGTYEFSMFRCNTNGPLDNSFGTFGRVVTEFAAGTYDAAFGVVIQPDGRIVLAGGSGPNFEVGLCRYNSNGTLDSTFGTGGKTTAAIGPANNYAIGVARQGDGKLVTGCRSQFGSFFKFAVARFSPNGSLDPAYGINGVNYFDFGTGADEYANGTALDSLGRLIMVGNVGNLFTIVRVSGDPVLRINSITRLANGHILLQGLGVPGGSSTVQRAPGLNPSGFAALGSVIPDSSGAWQYEDATATGSVIGFYRLSYP